MTMALPPILGGPSPSQQTPMQLDLDRPERAIAQLKAIRNSVIGSRTKKSNLVHTGVIEQLVQLLRIDLNSTPFASDLVSLSATIVASLANTPAQSTLLQLMRSGTSVHVETLPMTVKTKILSVVEMICAILAATIFIPGCNTDPGADRPTSLAEQIAHRRARILDFIASDSPFAPGSTSAEASSRGRSEGVPVSRLPSGLQAEVIRKGSRSRSRMKDADNPNLPPWEEDEPRSESDLTVSGPPCLFTVLLATAESGFVKAQEAALFCLAEITRDEPRASHRLFGYAAPSGTIPTTLLLNLRQSSNPNVRLAAFSCLANIVKVQPFSAKTHQCVLEVLMELLDTPSGPRAGSVSQGASTVETQIQAAFSIARLVADNVTLQTLATESFGALQKLATLLDQACNRSQPPSGKAERGSTTTILGSIAVSTPRHDATLGVAPPAVDESAIRLREACLTALAALTFQHDEPRRKLIDTVSPSVLTMVVSSIGFPALGVRVAACRLARALSRSLSILRTSIVDAGVAPKLVSLLQDPEEEEVVKIEATAAICNLVLDFSPMKKLILELGGVDSLVSLAHTGGSAPSTRDAERYFTLSASASMPPPSSSSHLSGSQQLRLHALWGLKNLLSHSDTPLKTQVMGKLSFDFIAGLCESPVMPFKEQALNILRNAAATKEADVTFMVSGMGGGSVLMGLLEKCIWEGKEAGEQGAAVIEQAAFVLVNVATGDEECRRSVVRAPNVLDALVFFCNHPWKDVRVAAARCVGNLLSRSKTEGKGDGEDLHEEAKARLIRFGLDGKMREMAQSDVELDVRERARSALNKFGLEA
uniref:Uncharacterized protein n=1 Tax=Kalmanozyma brasiliensis (strain GHG001) TaxID=1365824 RepID=V5EY93_KALBG